MIDFAALIFSYNGEQFRAERDSLYRAALASAPTDYTPDERGPTGRQKVTILIYKVILGYVKGHSTINTDEIILDSGF